MSLSRFLEAEARATIGKVDLLGLGLFSRG
jgi:hypothetical protein